MLLDLDRGLKSDPNDKKALITHKGMAHFAGTGPAGTFCRGCKFWKESGNVSHLYYSSGGKHGARLKPHPCQKFKHLTGSIGPGVPHNARSCKYFDEADKPPPIFDPRVK